MWFYFRCYDYPTKIGIRRIFINICKYNCKSLKKRLHRFNFHCWRKLAKKFFHYNLSSSVLHECIPVWTPLITVWTCLVYAPWFLKFFSCASSLPELLFLTPFPSIFVFCCYFFPLPVVWCFLVKNILSEALVTFLCSQRTQCEW